MPFSDLDAHLENAMEEVLRYTSTTINFCRLAASGSRGPSDPMGFSTTASV